jgi:copper chaperone
MTQIFHVTGMTCGHCERAVKAAVQQIDPQAVVTIDRSANRVEIDSSAARTALAQAISEEGYAVAADPPPA